MASPISFSVSFQCNTHPVQLSFSTVAPNHVAIGGFDEMVHVIDGNFYTESPAATPREVAPFAGMSVGTMPRLSMEAGGLETSKPHTYTVYAADSKLYRCYQDFKKSPTNTVTPEQDQVVEQFFAAAVKAFPRGMGIECVGRPHVPLGYTDLNQARACQATSEAFFGMPYTVYSHTSWFGWGNVRGYTVEPTCNPILQYSNVTPKGAEDAKRCATGRGRMGMPSEVQTYCNREFICTYTVMPKSVRISQK